MSVKVSVCMITYNHERFIAQAVESALMQQTNFDFEIVVGEDCSTDGTRAILLELQDRHPDKIRLLLRETNLGACRNSILTWNACRGQYLAILDGDDYWTCQHKLQKQVDFLEKHPECTVCGHQTLVIRETPDGRRSTNAPSCVQPARHPQVSSIESLLREQFLPNCTVMYRANRPLRVPEWFPQIGAADWILHLLHAARGKIGFLNEVMSVYRVHSASIWNGKSRAYRLSAEVLACRRVNELFSFRYDRILRDRIAALYQTCGWWAFQRADRSLAVRCAIRAIRERPLQSMNWRLLACALVKRVGSPA